jgi:hypothetical protein
MVIRSARPSTNWMGSVRVADIAIPNHVEVNMSQRNKPEWSNQSTTSCTIATSPTTTINARRYTGRSRLP